MSVYFDASVIVAITVRDVWSIRARTYVIDHQPSPVISDFAAAEVASVINLRVRTKDLSLAQAQTALSNFDLWRAGATRACGVTGADIAAADLFLRRLNLPLRAPDALHIAVARRLGLEIATFDTQMALSAKALDVRLAPA
ncbi:MAG TPA: type II toxin-antitoxin system VapC family toxin [Caulobacteraceae bacterium]|jgi:predicted nucleic acid-binding protein|nr:type II toxin-antitoxin system VapC family toxin [Caulobacteraceae bacterium]